MDLRLDTKPARVNCVPEVSPSPRLILSYEKTNHMRDKYRFAQKAFSVLLSLALILPGCGGGGGGGGTGATVAFPGTQNPAFIVAAPMQAPDHAKQAPVIDFDGTLHVGAGFALGQDRPLFVWLKEQATSIEITPYEPFRSSTPTFHMSTGFISAAHHHPAVSVGKMFHMERYLSISPRIANGIRHPATSTIVRLSITTSNVPAQNSIG